MEAVLATGAHFDPIELYRVVGIQMQIEALEKEGGVHAIRGRDAAAGRLIDPVFEAEDACGAADELYGATCAVYSVGVRSVQEIKGEGENAYCCTDCRLFCYSAVRDVVCVVDAGHIVEGPL